MEQMPNVVKAFQAFAVMLPPTLENLTEFAKAIEEAEEATAKHKRELGRKVNDMIEKAKAKKAAEKENEL